MSSFVFLLSVCACFSHLWFVSSIRYQSPPIEDGFDFHRILLRPGHYFSVKPAGPLFLMKRPLWFSTFALIQSQVLLLLERSSGQCPCSGSRNMRKMLCAVVVIILKNTQVKIIIIKKLLRPHHNLLLKIKDTIFLAWENCWHGATLPLASPKNDFWVVDSEPGTTNWRRFTKLFCLPWIKSLH